VEVVRYHRQWRWYSPKQGYPVSRREFDDLVDHGRAALISVMRRYEHNEHRHRHLTNLGNGLLELRTSVGNDEFRLLFFHDTPVHVIALLPFYKNTQKLPLKERRLAEQRMNEWIANGKKGSA